MALVRSAGADGCIYPISGSSLASVPSVCWGLGAGPYSGLPADQIEVRVRADWSGPGSVSVGSLRSVRRAHSPGRSSSFSGLTSTREERVGP